MFFTINNSIGGSEMKTALIIGVTGNFGSQMTQTFLNNGWQMKALIRDKTKAPDFISTSNIYIGDSKDENAVKAAAQSVSLIIYAANPAYHRWQEEALQMLEPTVRVAETLKLRILFPGNVYGYAPGEKAKTEMDEQNPLTDKGEIRIRMEERLKKSSKNGAKVTIIRAGDFIGPNMHMGWLDFILKGKNTKYSLAMPHDDKHVHFWSYLPDLCANAIKLIESPESDYDNWNDPGLKLTTSDWRETLKKNGYTVKMKSFPWWFFKVFSPFNPMLREVLKTRYLWQSTLVLDGSKLKKKLGNQFVQTSLEQIIRSITGKSDIRKNAA